MDVVHESLADGRPFRIVTAVDQWSRQSPTLEVGYRMNGTTVSDALDAARRANDNAARPHGAPGHLTPKEFADSRQVEQSQEAAQLHRRLSAFGTKARSCGRAARG
jgi:hypothetical protein